MRARAAAAAGLLVALLLTAAEPATAGAAQGARLSPSPRAPSASASGHHTDGGSGSHRPSRTAPGHSAGHTAGATAHKAAAPPPAVPADCAKTIRDLPRTPLASTWPQQRLGFSQVWPITMGQGVLVAVIDSGLDPDNPQLAAARVAPGINVTTDPSSADVTDCVGHGSEVAAMIAAQQTRDSSFLGIAPRATVLPVKQSRSSDDPLGAVFLARGIRAAAAAGADVANVSVTARSATPALIAAVRFAQRRGMVIVASVGNDLTTGNHPLYPAALSTRFTNVIAVSASDQNDGVPNFPERGPYVDVAAPGTGFQVPAPDHGFADARGTSYAAPYVTGTVALMLAAHPALTPVQVRDRLEATADPPPVPVPDSRFGYGIINPLLAVTTVRAGTGSPPSATPGPPVPARVAAQPPDRSTQHIALAAGCSLLALAALVLVGAGVLRGASVRRRAQG